MGYIPQSKLSINLDDIYVKRPCIGEELSGRVKDLEERFDNFNENYGEDQIIEDDLTDGLETYGNNLKKRRDFTEPTDADIDALKKKIRTALRNAEKKLAYFEQNDPVEKIEKQYIEAKEKGKDILNKHNEYQKEILASFNSLQETKAVNYAGTLGTDDIVGKDKKYSDECCPASQRIYDNINNDRKNTEKIISQNGNLNIQTKRNGSKITVVIELHNAGFLDGIENIEGENSIITSIKNSLNAYKNFILDAYNEIKRQIPDINEINKENYEELNSIATGILEEFTNRSGPEIDGINQTVRPNYVAEFQRIREQFNQLNDTQEAARKTEHAKHHKNGIKVTFYPAPEDYTGQYTVNGSPNSDVYYFKPGAYPTLEAGDGNSEWCEFEYWSTDTGKTIGSIIKNAEDTGEIQELTAYGNWKLNITIHYVDDDSTEHYTTHLGYNKDIKENAKNHYKNRINNFDKNAIVYTENVDGLQLYTGPHEYHVTYNSQTLCNLKIYWYPRDYSYGDNATTTSMPTINDDATFISYTVPKHSTIDETTFLNIKNAVTEQSSFFKDFINLKVGDEIQDEAFKNIYCLFRPVGWIHIEYEFSYKKFSINETTKILKETLYLKNIDDSDDFKYMYVPLLTKSKVKAYVENHYSNEFTSDSYDLVVSDLTQNQQKKYDTDDGINALFEIKRITVTARITNKKTNETTEKTYSCIKGITNKEIIDGLSEEKIPYDEKDYSIKEPYFKFIEFPSSDNKNLNDTVVNLEFYPEQKLSFLDGFGTPVEEFFYPYMTEVNIDKIDRTMLGFWPEEFIISDEKIYKLDSENPYQPTGKQVLRFDITVVPKYVDTKQIYNKLSVSIGLATYKPEPGDTTPMPGELTAIQSRIEEYPLTVINHGQPNVEDKFAVDIDTIIRKQSMIQKIPANSRREIEQHETTFRTNEVESRWKYFDKETNSAYDKATSDTGLIEFWSVNIDDLKTMPVCMFRPTTYTDQFEIWKMKKSNYPYGSRYSGVEHDAEHIPIKQIVKAPYYLTAKNNSSGWYDVPELTSDVATVDGESCILFKNTNDRLKTLKNDANNILVAYAFPFNILTGEATFWFDDDFDYDGISFNIAKGEKITVQMDLCDNPTVEYEAEQHPLRMTIKRLECNIPQLNPKQGYTLKLKEGKRNKEGTEISLDSKITKNSELFINHDVTNIKCQISYTDKYSNFTFYISKNAPTTQQNTVYGSDFDAIGNTQGTPVALKNGYSLTGDVEVSEGEDRQTKAREAIIASTQNAGGIEIKVGDETRTIQIA